MGCQDYSVSRTNMSTLNNYGYGNSADATCLPTKWWFWRSRQFSRFRYSAIKPGIMGTKRKDARYKHTKSRPSLSSSKVFKYLCLFFFFFFTSPKHQAYTKCITKSCCLLFQCSERKTRKFNKEGKEKIETNGPHHNSSILTSLATSQGLVFSIYSPVQWMQLHIQQV